MDNKKEIRLQVYLAQSGVGSRRGCEKLIEEGRVTVDGEVIRSQGFKVTGEEEVRFDSRIVKPMTRKIYLALHKPSGYICSNQDPDGRPLAKELFESAVPQRLFNVGRLDYMTSGLIFFTNDGEFSRIMTHPSCHLEKEYVITTKKPIPHELMENFSKGMTVEGEHFQCKEFQIQSEHRVRVILEEGKNRELRKVFQSRNISIKKVHRIRIGNVTLQGLQPGRFRNLTEREVERLFNAARNKGEDTKSGRFSGSPRWGGRKPAGGKSGDIPRRSSSGRNTAAKQRKERRGGSGHKNGGRTKK